VAGRRGPLRHNLRVFVDLETGQLEMLDHPFGQLLPRVVGGVLLEESA
jgi:hypothetical protein